MVFYARISAKKNKDDIRQRFLRYGALPEEIYLDDSGLQKQDGTMYYGIRASILSSGQILVLDSLSSLGKNAKEIAKELKVFAENKIRIIVLDLPITTAKMAEPIYLLSEVYSNLAANEIENLKNGQKKGIQEAKEQGRPYGRKKIPYPENWEEQYLKWKNKEISAIEFQNNCGLKKGTFYHLLKEAQQKDKMESNKQEA